MQLTLVTERMLHLGIPPILIQAESGESLSRALWLSGSIPPRPICAGLGRCGRCRVRYLDGAPQVLPAEKELLSGSTLAQGWRLACRRTVPKAHDDGYCLRLLLPDEAVPTAEPASGSFERLGDPDEKSGAWIGSDRFFPSSGTPDIFLAVDLGTTFVCWRAILAEDAEQGGVAAYGQFLNPQAGAGADVVSRLGAARTRAGRQRLSQLVRDALSRLVDDLAGNGLNVRKMCIAGNTAMTAILLDKDIEGLCAAPYRMPYDGCETVEIKGLPPAYIPPLPGPFIGGDVCAGVMEMLAFPMQRPWLLADLGTNGEIALMTADGRLFFASVPLGPAMEGVGPSFGQPVGPGVAVRFDVTPGGIMPVDCQGHSPAVLGISATGYLSLLAHLKRFGLMDACGGFRKPPASAMPFARRLADGFGRVGGRPALELPGGMRLESGDVEDLLKVRAAFAVALDALCAEAGMPPKGLATFCLAGALGEHANPADLETLGFVPAAGTGKIVSMGNTSLAGATRLLIQGNAASELAVLCRTARLLAPADTPSFQTAYLNAMRWGEQQ
ncbi:MAG: ASKHA domain-containing protein [Desulfovibrio sp.]|nr:ASKHA domain-containing protein [Desulfovibrio sp.]